MERGDEVKTKIAKPAHGIEIGETGRVLKVVKGGGWVSFVGERGQLKGFTYLADEEVENLTAVQPQPSLPKHL